MIGVDGYEDNRKILISFPDDNLDSVPDNPDLFDILVAPTVNEQDKFVFYILTTDQYDFSRYDPVEQGTIVSQYQTKDQIESNLSLYLENTIFYATAEDAFYQSLGTSTVEVTTYLAKVGRQELMFQYTHNAPNDRRIDPSPNNLIDFYILTKEYSDQYYAYIKDTSNKVVEPQIPTNDELKINFGSIESYKSISDSIIYNSAVFKPLFGIKAAPSLRATFKIVKNPNISITDNDIKSQVISAINTYFDVNNWDFGESFYFSELSAYLHSSLTPNVSSIIIVPDATTSNFGTLYQINAEPNEIMVSAATVDNVQIISAITAGQLKQ